MQQGLHRNGDKMKKTVTLLLLLVLVVGIGIGITKMYHKNTGEEKDKLTIVTSFYPVYIATDNLVAGMENIELVNLTENRGSCLHDYQLTTEDMQKLEQADVFIINGGGMESFAEEIIKNYPDIKVIDSSEGITLLPSETEHHHEEQGSVATEGAIHQEESHEEAEHEEEEGHNHGAYNGHIWLSPTNYMKQLENIRDGLMEYDNEHKSQYEQNAQVYLEKINLLQVQMQEQLARINKEEVIIFHDAFSYLAKELSIPVVLSVAVEEDSALGAGEVAEIIDEVKRHHIKVLFTEEQLKGQIADSIAKETNAKVYTIDSLVSGELDRDSYLNGMKHNIEVLQEAFENTKE